MVKTPIIQQEGQALTIPNEKADEMPITLSYSQARALAKQLRPPPSEKQKEHIAKLVEANKLKWQQQKEQKEVENKQKQEEIARTTTKIVVKPKRIYKPKLAPQVEQVEYEEVEEEEEPEPERPRQKKVVKKKVESESDDDEIIQKTTKAKKLLETVSKLDSTIDRLKQTGNKYDQLLNNKLRF
jgi:hypothetical protein